MPKPMSVTIEVEEIAFGAVFRKLRNMEGVVSIDLEGEPDPQPKKPGGLERFQAPESASKKKAGSRGSDAAGTSLRCILLDYMDQAGRPCPSVELQRKAEDANFAPSTYANVAYGLGRNKLAKRTKKGWVLTAKGRKYLATECKLEPEE